MNKNKLLLIFILVFFLITRLYKITETPASLYWDEASIGYNAYSILKDGRDQWGEFLPLHFRAFGEFKLPVYIYAVATTQTVFGLNELSVRLPAVLFSLFTIILTYLLAFKMTKSEKTALVSAFFLSISPWFFLFSRVGYEASAGLMFYLLGIYLFSFVYKRNFLIFLSSACFIFSMYSYNSFRIIVPLTIICLFLFVFKTVILKSKRLIFFSVTAFSILLLASIPIIRLIRSEDGNSRIQAVGIFNEAGDIEKISISFLSNYFAHLNPNFLFFEGDKNLRSHIGDLGQLYFSDLPLIIFGIMYFFLCYKKQKKDKDISLDRKLLLFISTVALLISFIPAAITRESPHALRSIAAVPFLSIISAGGFAFVVKSLKTRRFFTNASLLGGLIIISSYLIFFAIFYNNFIGKYKINSAIDWQYGYKRLVLNYAQEFDKYDHVIISDRYAQPYIYPLFYLKYDPKKFRSEVEYNSLDKWGFSTVASFKNFVFRRVEESELPMGKSLIFASAENRLRSFTEKDRILSLDGSVSFYVYEVNK